MLRGVLALGLFSALIASSTAGCVGYPGMLQAPTATIKLRPGLAGAIAPVVRYAIRQAGEVQGYGAADVSHIELSLHTVTNNGNTVDPVIVDGGVAMVMVRNQGGNFADAEVSFTHLQRGATYRIQAAAFGKDLSGFEVDLTNPDPAAPSHIDVEVGLNDQLVTDANGDPIVVPVNLKPKVIAAGATGTGIAITPGTASPVPYTPPVTQ